MAGKTKTPEYKAKFPIGQIPALEDGEFRLVRALSYNPHVYVCVCVYLLCMFFMSCITVKC
jgi:hypothetical protein